MVHLTAALEEQNSRHTYVNVSPLFFGNTDKCNFFSSNERHNGSEIEILEIVNFLLYLIFFFCILCSPSYAGTDLNNEIRRCNVKKMFLKTGKTHSHQSVLLQR